MFLAECSEDCKQSPHQKNLALVDFNILTNFQHLDKDQDEKTGFESGAN